MVNIRKSPRHRSPSSLWRGGDIPKLATSGVMVNIRKSSHHHIHRSRSGDITCYPCCIVMLLVLFNKIRAHSYHTVLRWFLVSITPFDNDPILNCCVWVTPSGLGLRFTANVYRVPMKKLGLRRLGLAPVARGRSRVTDRVIDRRQGALRIHRRLCDRKSRDPHLLVPSFTWSFRLINYSRFIYIINNSSVFRDRQTLSFYSFHLTNKNFKLFAPEDIYYIYYMNFRRTSTW